MWRAAAESQVFHRVRAGFQWRLSAEHFRSLSHFSIFELSFLIAYEYAMGMTSRTGAPFWLPDSVLLCTLLLSQPRSWPIFLAATLPIRLMVAVPPEAPTWFLLAAFANDSLKALLAATLLRRFLRGRGIGFDSLHDFWIYLAAAVVVAPALSGILGAAAWMARGRPFGLVWRDWTFGNALTNLVLTPLLLCLVRDWRILKAKRATYLQAFAVFSGLFLALEFARQRGLNNLSVLDLYHYMPMPFLLLAAVRFGPAGASGSLAVMSMLWIEPVAALAIPSASIDATVLSTQLFLMVVGVPIMCLSVLMAQQRKTERSLRESEERTRNMADTAPVMIWISGSDQRATFFNRGWLDFTGRRLDQELGFGWAESVHPGQRADCLTGYSSAFEDRRLWEAECQLRRATGQYRWMLFRGAPRFSAERVFDGYIISAADITELKTAQEASLARQKLESLGLLAGGIAHDFNNLLGGIHANAEIAEAATVEGSFPGEEIQNIKSISMRASGIVRQLMIYAGNEESDVELLNLSQLVEEMLDLIKISISKSAVLRTNLEQNLPPVLGNGPQVQQVVMNLILNASDSLIGRDGVITVRTSLETAAGIPVFPSTGRFRTGNCVRLEVSDTGSGISKEDQVRIFDPFFTTKIAGRGLGLAVVQGIVRAHKGLIELTSAPDHGTTFRVLWPIASQMPDRPVRFGPLRTPLQSVRSTGTVLVVEDEHLLRVSVAKTLRKEGFSVIEVADGTTAVDLFRNQRQQIDVVLLDMTIPGETSSRVIAEVARLRANAKLLLMSAYSRQMVGPVADDAQVSGFIRKPFQLRELVALVREVLSA
ncbi:MAG TPA: ATP-binding protein [Bryobacteraceae bacterium]|nr:ATP-binding protein [Bryobacteraceae bacterium]